MPFKKLQPSPSATVAATKKSVKTDLIIVSTCYFCNEFLLQICKKISKNHHPEESATSDATWPRAWADWSSV
jgi:hypothetical protein